MVLGKGSYDGAYANVARMDFPVVRTCHADVDGPTGPTIANPKAGPADDPVDGDIADGASGVR